MFERYTERARRVIFFARYEASQFGSTTIESEHFLLGVIREDKPLLQHFVGQTTSIVALRKEIENHIEPREKISDSINLPLSDECKRILAYTTEEAERLSAIRIETGHLLLGILREEGCVAAKVLTGLGLKLKTAREEMLRTPPSIAGNIAGAISNYAMGSSFARTPLPAAGVVPDVDTAKRIAEAVWLPRFSVAPDDQIQAIHAELKFDVWIVAGTLTGSNDRTNLGAFIQKEDGKILRLHQEKIDS